MNLVEFCKSRFSLFALWSGLLSISVGIAAGFFAGANPLYLALAIGAISLDFRIGVEGYFDPEDRKSNV